jgi:L-threonylcarbamoyladenylate synthase
VDVGVESTIVGCFDEPMLLRPGGVPRGEIERVLGRALKLPPADAASDSAQPLAPGMLASHYAPRAKVRLHAESVEPGEALLAFGLGAISGIDAAAMVMNLSERGDLNEAATNLFGHLRALDARGARTIAVMPIPDEGLGEAINDRLRRAAVGRE